MIDYDPRRWSRILVQLRGSVLPHLVPRIVLCAAIGALAAWLFDERGVKIPSLVHSLIGVALGLLLVFRTNASYDRYWEGRKLLGTITNRVRDLTRQASVYITGDDAEARAARTDLRRLVLAWNGLLRQHLRKERDLAALGALLTPAERQALEGIRVRPCVAVQWASARLADCARAGRLTEQRLQLMDANLTALIDAWGGAERIMKTPVPFAYAQHIKTFLALFCFTVPFALVDAMRWYTPIAAAILGFALFGIDEIGVEIEDPFGYDPNDLPLDKMAENLDHDTAAILAASPPPAAPPAPRAAA